MKTCDNKHLIIVNYAYQEDLSSPKELLSRYFMLSDWAQACHLQGVPVTVFQRFHSNHEVTSGGVDYIFVKDALPPFLRYYQCAWQLNKALLDYLQKLGPQTAITLHINGLVFPMCVWHLSSLCPEIIIQDNFWRTFRSSKWNFSHIFNKLKMAAHPCAATPVQRNCVSGQAPAIITRKNVRFVVQHHAEQADNSLLCLLNRLSKKRIDHYFFTTSFHAQDWLAKKAIVEDKIAPLMECSSACRPQDKSKARAKTGLSGNPLLLWTANLDHNKDPLTILSGFAQFMPYYPQAHLVMLYMNSKLLPQVQEKIARTEILRDTVTLLGRVDYHAISDYYNAADIFVQGSAREGSGIAVLDALRCGAIPVISRIPSFEMLTDNGKVGALWRRGEVSELVKALRNVMATDLEKHQQRCQQLFEDKWTFEKLAQQALEYYFD